MKVEESVFGTKITAKKHIVFFGKSDFQKAKWQELFPHTNFTSLHQTHSKICVESKMGPEQKADAHYSYDKNRALIIKTADCVPLMFYCPISDTVLAVHAGWRGLVNGIIRTSIEKAFSYSKRANLESYIGPHIALNNYEFKKEDIDLIKKDHDYLFYKEINNKYYFDLSAIYLKELNDLGLSNENIHLFNSDTYSSDEYFSFRKTQTKERLYHFIVRIA